MRLTFGVGVAWDTDEATGVVEGAEALDEAGDDKEVATEGFRRGST
jgi:hypothetical protein